MTLTGTWAKHRTGALALQWTARDAPVRHRRTPPTPGISEGRHRD
jgi:hypothetical protein